MGQCYKQLSVDERNQMQRGLNAGQSLRALARSMNRSPGTLSAHSTPFGNTSRFFTTANADIHGLATWPPLCLHRPSHGRPLETGLSTIVRVPHRARP